MWQTFVGDAKLMYIFYFQDVDYLRAHYNIDNYIQFSQYRSEEHVHIRHFVLKPFLGLLSKHFFKEVLAHKSCLYYRTYPRHCSHQVSADWGPLRPSLIKIKL